MCICRKGAFRCGTTFAAAQDNQDNQNLTDLRHHLNTDTYLSPHSDIVALMVLEYQTRMQNLITRVGFETRMAIASQTSQTAINIALREPADQTRESTTRRINSAVDELVAYMLFANEAPIQSRITVTSTFALVQSAVLVIVT